MHLVHADEDTASERIGLLALNTEGGGPDTAHPPANQMINGRLLLLGRLLGCLFLFLAALPLGCLLLRRLHQLKHGHLAGIP